MGSVTDTDIELNQLIEGLKNRGFTFGMLTTVRQSVARDKVTKRAGNRSKQNHIRGIDTNS
jgi:hypothetical protein